MLDHVIGMHHIFIVSGTSMYISFYLQWDVGSSPSVERWCILLSSSSVVRRCISSFYLQWDVGSSPSVERWCILLSSSSVVRRYISFIVSGTSMNHLFSISSVVRWYISLIPSVERWYVLSSVVRRYISFIVSGTSMNIFFISSVVRWYTSLSYLQWNVGMCYRQWYGGTSLSSSVVRRLIISFYIISGTVVYLFNAFSGTWVCVIVNGTAVHLFHRQWYVDELSPFISSVVR